MTDATENAEAGAFDAAVQCVGLVGFLVLEGREQGAVDGGGERDVGGVMEIASAGFQVAWLEPAAVVGDADGTSDGA